MVGVIAEVDRQLTKRRHLFHAVMPHQRRGPLSPITGKFYGQTCSESEWTSMLKKASSPGKPTFAHVS